MTDVIGIITLACGLYCLYGAILMRFKRKIKQSLVMVKAVDLKTCKDLEGYCKEAQVPLFVLGAIVTLYSLVDLCNTQFGGLGILYWIMLALALLSLVWYTKKIREINKKYFGIL